MTAPRWQFWIDRGGTFTDCIGVDPTSGALSVVKVLSSDRAPLEAIRRILALGEDAAIPPCDVRMGTTVATNALLERCGTPCALVTTEGFGDLLLIGDQARPRLFELAIRKRETLPVAVIETEARGSPDGGVLSEPDTGRLTAKLTQLASSGVRSVAIALLHSYANGRLERDIAACCRAAGVEHVTLSHEIAPEIGLLARADTAVLDAYLTPLLFSYVNRLERELTGSSLRVMQSSGQLSDCRHLRGPHAILSGPAGGVVAVASIAERLGIGHAIGFDMGGTSTDVSRFAGAFERSYEGEVAAVRIRAPMLQIHTVAAGGGSLCSFDGRRFRVGPESAGADPGPVAYGNPTARRITITDANLVLGRLPSDRFPLHLDVARVEAAFDELVERLESLGTPMTREQIAEGFVDVANSNMADAIRRVSVARGYDARRHALVVFGGAGGQHACAVARALGIETIVIPALAGVFSAYGMGHADVGWHGQADAGRVALADDALKGAEATFRGLESEGHAVLASEGVHATDVIGTRRLALRYRGTQTALDVDVGPSDVVAAAFHAAHRTRFGYARPEHPIEIVVYRVELRSRRASSAEPSRSTMPSASDRVPLRTARLWWGGAWHDAVPVYAREDLTVGTAFSGPAMVVDAATTIVVDPGFSLDVVDSDVITLRARTQSSEDRTHRVQSSATDPVLLEIMANHYMSIAEQMGEMLRRTAVSTNIRERLDFSCAVFDGQGGLVANAPHIPVHLGAMSESVRAVIAAHARMPRGTAYVTNDPAQGGSHLPDITVVTPVHDTRGQLIFFTASRGHHADVGGTTPGSMPAFSSRIGEEGVVLSNLSIVSDGRFERDALRRVLESGEHPCRRPDDNLADIDAQLAANRLGAELLLRLVEEHGLGTVERYMQLVQDDAAAKVADAIAELPDAEYRFEDAMDSGARIAVRLKVAGSTLEIDFAGTSAQTDDNLNAPRAVTLAAVLYVLRALVAAPIPLNGGCLRPVHVEIPAGSILDPSPGRAVAGGNVETSQRVVDVLLGALGRAAASQGTMNNVSFGNSSFGYYETIAGGAGAGPGFHGESGVHTHMTNTRITDVEILEAQYPVRIVRFALRRGSGGRGRWSGGDGLVREFEFLAPVEVSILSERRDRAPFGLDGADAGATGNNSVDGKSVGGKTSLRLLAGQRLRIETPGGGGYGRRE